MRSISRRRVLAVSATSLLTVGLMAGCSTVSSDSGGAVPGVTDDTISLGVLSPFTGAFAAAGLSQLAGVNLYWDSINANGGVCGGKNVEIVSRDNGFDPQKTVTAYSGIKEDILAVQLVTATAPTQAIAPLMEKDGVVGITSSSSPAVLEFPNILAPGTPFDLEMVNAVDYLVGEGTIAEGDSVGYIYFQGDFGEAGYEGAKFGGEKHNITVNPYQIDPTVTDLSSQVADIQAKGSKAIFLSASPGLLANAAGVSQTNGFDVPLIIANPTFAPEVLASPAADAIAARTTVVSSINAWSGDAPSLVDLRALYEASDKESPPQQYLIGGYASGLLLKTAIDAACEKGDLTRESLAEELNSIDTFDMQDLSVDVSYVDRATGPAQKNFFLKVDKDAVGGLDLLNTEPFEGENAKAFLATKE